MQPHKYHHPDRTGGPPLQSSSSLTRYSSAPAGSAYLSALVDSVISGSAAPAEFPISGSAAPAEFPISEPDHLGGNVPSTGRGVGGVFFRPSGALEPPPAPPSARPYDDLETAHHHHISATVAGDLGDVCGHDAAGQAAAQPPSSSALLFRHNSSPAGVFHQLILDEHGFSMATASGGLGVYPQHPGGIQFPGGNRKLRSQLRYPSRQNSLSSISEISMPNVAASSNPHVGSDYQVGGSWDDGGTIAFRGASVGVDRQLVGDSSGDFMSALDDIDSSFNLPGSSLEMAAMEQLLQIQQDTVACKARRTRISEKLKKLQDLVPNMDKQTNTADMLELAVQHIKGLQSQVQKLNAEQSNCVCSQSDAYGR